MSHLAGEENNNNQGGMGLFGEDDEDQHQAQQYDDDGIDDILGLDDEDAEEGAMPNPEGSLLMRFCPHDSSMLYPKVSVVYDSLLLLLYTSHEHMM